MHTWQIIESGSLSPQAIMAKDQRLLDELNPDEAPILHLYEWNTPCLTYGYFIQPATHLNLAALEEEGIAFARRPTGGGIIFHLTDFAFSLLIPSGHPGYSLNTLENYAFIHRKIAQLLHAFTLDQTSPDLLNFNVPCEKKECHAFCMAKPTQYDLMLDGKKVGGAAQRRSQKGFLHQGTLSLLFPPTEVLKKVLKQADVVIEAMKANTHCLLPEESTQQDLDSARLKLKKLFKS